MPQINKGPEWETQVLDNGLQIIFSEIKTTRLVHIGLFINTGSRDEAENLNGLSHFLEHMLFKGTKRRSSGRVIERLESVGGEINAFTTKEKTCIYATVASEFLDRAVELFADIAFQCTFPEKEILKEIQVISEEIEMYRDNPEEAIQEDFDLLLLPEHPLGRPILGTKNTLKNLDKGSVQNWYQTSLNPGNMLLGISGNVSYSKVLNSVNKYWNIPYSVLDNKLTKRKPPVPFQKSQTNVESSGNQSHLIIGSVAGGYDHPDYYTMLLICNFLGGPGMSARLNLLIREKFGLAYNISSFYNPYTDCGIFGIYAGMEEKNIKKVISLIKSELYKLVETPISDHQLKKFKKQLIGQTLIASENLMNQLMYAAREQQDHGFILGMDQFIEYIESINSQKIIECSTKWLNPETLSEIIYLPENQKR